MRLNGLVLLGIALSAFAVLLGCGGAGGPVGGGSPLEDPPDTELLVRLSYSEGFCLGGWEVAVYRDGRCRARIRRSEPGGPIGLFETRLGSAQLAQIRTAAGRAAAAGLKRHYGCGEDMSWCSLDLRSGAKPRTVGYGPWCRRIPQVLAALYEEAGSYPIAKRGLLWEAHKQARNHPVTAVVLEGGPTKAAYRIGEGIPLALTLRNVGTYPVAAATMECQEVVYGECRVALAAPPGVDPPIGPGDGCRIARVEFGGSRNFRIRNDLSPEALVDLDRFVILQPDATYAIPWSPTVSGNRRGRHYLLAHYVVQSRYDVAAIDQVLPARFTDGVCVWESPWIDIVK